MIARSHAEAPMLLMYKKLRIALSADDVDLGERLALCTDGKMMFVFILRTRSHLARRSLLLPGGDKQKTSAMPTHPSAQS